MDMVRRALLQAYREIPYDAQAIELVTDMRLRMVRWIKLGVYPKRDWPQDFGEYPKHLEKEIKD